MKSDSFDISPVIGLFDALSVSNDPAIIQRSKHHASRNISSGLGDFSALWQFLNSGSTESRSVGDSALTPCPLSFATTTGAGDPEPTAPSISSTTSFVEPALEKRRRQVTFEPVLVEDASRIAPSHALTGDTPSQQYSLSSEYTTVPSIRSAGSAVDRKLQIIQKLLVMFPQDAAALLSPRVLENDPAAAGIHVFIDNSNVLISFYDRVKRSRGYAKYERVRRPAFSFHGLSLILERGRTAVKKVLVGSSPITPAVLEARSLGYEASILERVFKERPNRLGQYSTSSGSESTTERRLRMVEQAVDEVIHLKILESLLDYPPSTVVLASGDGAAGEYSLGFTRVIERCLERGWKVELMSFKKNLSGFYRDRDFRRRWGDQFRFVPLDEFVEELLG